MENRSPVDINAVRESMTARNNSISPTQRRALASEFQAWQEAGLQQATYLHDRAEMTKFMDDYMSEHQIVGAKPSRIQFTSSMIGTVFFPYIEASAERFLARGDNERFITAVDAAFGFQQAIMLPVAAERHLKGEAYMPTDEEQGLSSDIDKYLKSSVYIQEFSATLAYDRSGTTVIRDLIKELKKDTSKFGDEKRIPEFVAAGAEAALSLYSLIYPYTKGFDRD